MRVIQTEASTRFVGTASFAGITGAPVLITEWEPDPLRGAFPGDPTPAHAPLSHLELVQTADVFVDRAGVARTRSPSSPPATADNLLTAAALACRRPLVVAPAMNDAMYEHPATQANLATLRARGAIVLEPGTGALGSPGEWGIGRLPEPPELLAAVEAALAAAPKRPRRPRACSSPPAARASRSTPCASSATARRAGWASRSPSEAARRGADVTVVAANVALPRHAGVRYVDVETAAELGAACADAFDALRRRC